MIFYEGLESIIECIYLEESISNKLSECNIFVNPENIKYLIGKLVIINTVEYPVENIKLLLDNNCRVISRIHFDIDGIEVRPYILKLNFNIVWNGKYVSKFFDFNDLFLEDDCEFDIDKQILYFPKIDEHDLQIKTTDNLGNLSVLGWVLQQVGVNIKTDTPFCNIEIIKTKKVLLD